MIDGLIVVDKPAGMTSHDVVARLRRAARQKRVGHAGTLDPDATGVLLVGMGRATRLLRWLSESGKEYRATVVFGTATDTLDASGVVVAEAEMPDVDAMTVAAALHRFRGEISQVPPMVSAVKVGGRRLHELAREGQEVERPARTVTIHELELEACEPGPPAVATLRVACSSGTYIRTLAADLGEALGGVAHMGTLRRLRVGGFGLDDATPLEVVETDPGAVLLAPVEAVRDMFRVDVDDDVAASVPFGTVFEPGQLAPGRDLPAGRPLAVVGPDGTLLAVYEIDEQHRRGVVARPAVVLVEPPATRRPPGG